MTGAELFVACLEAAGIEVVYGLPGEENTALMLALKDSDIRFVLVRHEQTAAFMASVHGRLTGRPAACLATLGPGATNLVTGVADATQDFAPLLAITGQGETRRLARSESHQVVDLTALFEPVTKHSQTLMDAAEIPEAIARAVQIATTPRPGAVHLSLPVDVAAQAVEGTPHPVPPRGEVVAHADTIRAAAEALAAATHPVVLAGGGVVRAGAAPALAAFCEAHEVPLAASFMGTGILPPDHALALGTYGQPFADHVDGALEAADLIVAVGFDPIETAPAGFPGDGPRRVLHIAQTPAAADVGWHVVADVTGALEPALRDLSAALDGRRWGLSPQAAEAQRALRAERVHLPPPDATSPIRPEDILTVVADHLTPDDTVISGVGTHKLKIARSLLPERAGQVIIANGLAGMGLALPGAMVAADLRSGGRSFAIVGDGEFLMNVQDMETAARLGSPITVLLWEDGGYGLIEEKQEEEADSHTDLSFGNPGWADLCKAFDWQHIAVDGYGDLSAALQVSRNRNGPVLVTLKVDYSEGLRPGDEA